MTKVNIELATKELNSVLSDWADGSELPFDDDAFKKIYNAILGKIQSGNVTIDTEKNTINLKDYVFKVPLGDALLTMGNQDVAGLMNTAAIMVGKEPGHFATVDARITKTAVMVTSLFMQV